MGKWAASVALLVVAAAAAEASGVAARPVKRLLHVSDVHMNHSRALGVADERERVISYAVDATPALLRSALAYARSVLPEPDVFLYTGDSAAHFVTDPELRAHEMRTTASIIEEFYPSTPVEGRLHVSSVVGNADTTPGYYMSITDPEYETNPALTWFNDVWPTNELSVADRETLARRGYLSYELDEKLTVLSLNTLPYSPKTTPSPSVERDPFGQFKWLNETLRELKRAGRVAYIVGHIPPVIAAHTDQPVWHPEYIASYKQVVREHTAIIKAQIFGHVHSVEFRVGDLGVASETKHSLRTANGAKRAAVPEPPPLYTGAAIAPMFGNNPGFMIWEIDPTTYDLLDYVVYGANLTEAVDDMQWGPLFRASEAYGLKSLAASELKDMMSRADADPELLERYYYSSRALSFRQESCANDPICHAKWMCSMTWLTFPSDLDACMAHQAATQPAPPTIEPVVVLPWHHQAYEKVVDLGELAKCVAALWVFGVVLLLHFIKRRKQKRIMPNSSSDTCPM